MRTIVPNNRTHEPPVRTVACESPLVLTLKFHTDGNEIAGLAKCLASFPWD